MISNKLVLFLLALLTLSLGGCAALKSSKPEELGWAVRSFQVDEIVETRSGDVLSFDTLMDELAGAHVIYVGETHTSPHDHRIQLRIAQALHRRFPDMKLAMEMFPRESQPVLDRYSRGLITEEEFIKEVEWQKVWGFPFALYKPILNWAAENKVPILGINAPQDVARSISRGGLADLSETDRSRVAQDFDLNDFDHRRYVEQQYEQHVKGRIRDVNAFYEAQLAWEETMAETLAQHLVGPGKSAKILVLAGRGHVNYRFGVPLRTVRRVDHPYKIVLPMPINTSESIVDPGLADYVWVTQIPEQPKRGRLGVMVRSVANGSGLEVMAVAPESPAERAGIRVGDVILMVNGIEIKSIDVLHDVIAEKRDAHEVKIRRNHRSMTVQVSIPEE